MHNPIENLRHSYKPDYIRILIVGESTPTLRDFFYSGNSAFTTCTRKAFESAKQVNFISNKAFLIYFKSQGYFFDELSRGPFHHPKNTIRRQALNESVLYLATRIQMYQPEVVIACPEKIEPHVQEAIRIADIKCHFYVLPFPDALCQKQYVSGLVSIIKEH